MNFWFKVRHLDRRIIFLLMALGVALAAIGKDRSAGAGDS